MSATTIVDTIDIELQIESVFTPNINYSLQWVNNLLTFCIFNVEIFLYINSSIVFILTFYYTSLFKVIRGWVKPNRINTEIWDRLYDYDYCALWTWIVPLLSEWPQVKIMFKLTKVESWQWLITETTFNIELT